jgi:hypothetical protein
MAKLSGGGITSNKLKNVGIRKGARASDKVSTSGLAQLGVAQGSKLKEGGSYTSQPSGTPLFSGSRPQPVPLGNAKSLDVGAGGVGTGRTVMRSGSQGTHGPVAAGSTHPRRGLIEEFGPDVPGSRR